VKDGVNKMLEICKDMGRLLISKKGNENEGF
jgi:hypothetical protein